MYDKVFFISVKIASASQHIIFCIMPHNICERLHNSHAELTGLSDAAHTSPYKHTSTTHVAYRVGEVTKKKMPVRSSWRKITNICLISSISAQVHFQRTNTV